MPELEFFMPNKRRSSTGAIQYGEKQRRFSDSTKNFNKRTYSGDYSTPQRRGYTDYNNNFKGSSYFKGPTQQRRPWVSSFRANRKM